MGGAVDGSRRPPQGAPHNLRGQALCPAKPHPDQAGRHSALRLDRGADLPLSRRAQTLRQPPSRERGIPRPERGYHAPHPSLPAGMSRQRRLNRYDSGQSGTSFSLPHAAEGQGKRTRRLGGRGLPGRRASAGLSAHIHADADRRLASTGTACPKMERSG